MTSTPDDGSETDGPSQPDPPAGADADPPAGADADPPAGAGAGDLTSLDPGRDRRA